jgi:hypothetical protein
MNTFILHRKFDLYWPILSLIKTNCMPLRFKNSIPKHRRFVFLCAKQYTGSTKSPWRAAEENTWQVCCIMTIGTCMTTVLITMRINQWSSKNNSKVAKNRRIRCYIKLNIIITTNSIITVVYANIWRMNST